jgi:hypothetical protein
MNNPSFTRFAFTVLVGAMAAFTALAQTDKSVAVEHVPAFPAFNQWAGTVVTVPDAPVTTVQPVPLTVTSTGAGEVYQPLPVIVGLPDLPLVGPGAAAVARNWSPSFNYQGVILRQLVLDSRASKRELRAMASPLKNGERFKIRVTATFDAVAVVDQVVGDVWYGRRTGQVYPQPGMSVQIKAGETVDLPLGVNDYFLMNRPANERLVVSVRHAKANAEGRSDQPAYRQDGKLGSLYLQLVPGGKYPAVEQLVSQAP